LIATLSGVVKVVVDDSVILDVQGVGFRVHVTETFLQDGLQRGRRVDVFTHLSVRENDLSLYGFGTQHELDLFQMLIGVSGVGPRTAMAALSAFSPEVLRSAIVRGDVAAITRIPGIGRKTAERMMLDLKDRVGADYAVTAEPLSEDDQDVLNALTALGYSLAEARQALGEIPAAVEALDDRILASLRYLGSS